MALVANLNVIKHLTTLHPLQRLSPMITWTLRLLMAWALMLPLAHAETYQVKMLNSNDTGVMAFEPDYLHIQPGDTVHFVASDRTHNAMTIPNLWPDGAPTIRTPMNQDADVTFQQAGFYGIKCLPHFMLGMVMLIEVGAPNTKVEIPNNLPAMAQKRFGDILQRAQH